MKYLLVPLVLLGLPFAAAGFLYSTARHGFAAGMHVYDSIWDACA